MTTQRRILICDDLHEVCLETLRARGYEPEVKTGMSEEELCQEVKGVHALIVRSATKITRPVIEAADVLEVVGRAGVGVDNVDKAAATERGVVVMNTPTGNTTTTGELAIAHLTALSRHLPRADRTVRSGTWKKKGLMGTELTGKTLGVIGLGRIGRVVAERALGLRMNVIATDPYLLQTGAGSPIDGVELMELDEMLPASDFVTLHVPLTDDTRGLLNEERLRALKPGARVINCARGGLIDEGALAQALDDGHLAGAALDVLAEEPPSPEHPLLNRDDVILTPHLGASSHEAQRNVAVQIAEQFADFFETGEAHNAVNAPVLSAQVRASLGPYLSVAEKMGSYLAQRADQPICKLEVTVAGQIADSQTAEAVRLATLVSVMRQSHDLGVNFVNAPVLAESRGLSVLSGTRAKADPFQNVIEVTSSSKDGSESHVLQGTAFGGRPRLVEINDMTVDITPTGPLLVTRHHDRPGVLGTLGSLLGERGVNIRRVDLGPPTDRNAGFASAFLSLYERPTDDVVAALGALDGIDAVNLIEL